MDAHKNFAKSTIAVAPIPASSGVSLTVATGEGALFPTVPFNATVWPTGQQPTAANSEIVRVTANVADVFTFVRTQESSSARTIIVGDQIAATITNKTLTDIEAAAGVAPFPPTLANVVNTTTDTVTVSFPIPGGSMADMDILAVYVSALVKNNKGTTGFPKWTVLYGAAASAQLTGATGWLDDTAEGKFMLEFRCQRVGNDLWWYFQTTNTLGANPLSWPTGGDGIGGTNAAAYVISAPSFSTNQTFSIKLQLAAADASYYFKPQAVKARLL